MKSFKAILATASVVLAFVGQSSADVTFRVTGSTAFRAAAHATFRDMLTSPIYKYSGSSLAGSNNVLFQGTIAGQSALGVVTIKATWSGSTDGINVMANGLTTTAYYADATSATSGGAASITAGITETGNVADMILMDTTQGLTPYQANPITDQPIGILPFVWVAGKSVPSSLTNVTAQATRQMFATGYLSLSAFTGNGADAPVNTDGTTGTGWTIFMAGRDNGSGTRTSTLSESGYGALTTVAQVGPTAGYTVATTTGSNVLNVALADRPGLSLNMVGKAISGTGIPASTTITSVTASTLVISANATATGATVVATIGGSATFTAAGLFTTPAGGNGGQASGGNLADQLRWTTTGASDPFGLQANNSYSTNVALISYLGLSDADRAVNGTGTSVGSGANGARFLSYEGASCMGGVVASLTIGSQAAGSTSLTITSGATTGIIAGQLVSGTGIAPGTTVVSTTSNTITLSAATTNVTTLTNNVIKAQQFLPATVRSGQYSFWSYERIGYRTLNSDKTKVKDAFYNQVTSSSTDLGAVSGLPDDADMRVTRGDVGSPISLKF